MDIYDFEKEIGPRVIFWPCPGAVYLYMTIIVFIGVFSGEHLQDHWSSG